MGSTAGYGFIEFGKFLSLCGLCGIEDECEPVRWLKTDVAGHVAGVSRDGWARGSRRRFLGGHFGLFFSNLEW
jgi:hypothetical protein